MTELTPMMRQYRDCKAEIPPDAILLFRLGDFYEMFFEDAVKASAIMELTLTKRQGYPMCGFPYHALDSQLPRLLAANVKVAIAEQLEDPKLVKGMVKRAVTRIITPGTVVDPSILTPGKSNYLVAYNARKDLAAIASLDISTGEFRVTELDSPRAVESELHRLAARECLVPEGKLAGWQAEKRLPESGLTCTEIDEWIFDDANAEEELQKHFHVLSLDGFGCRGLSVGLGAAAAVLHYATANLRQDAAHVTSLKVYRTGNFMELDAISQRNLELVEPMFGGSRAMTLLGTLDLTATPMGGRLLREWILRPLYDCDAINRRFDAVEVLRDDPLTLAELIETLQMVRDLERITARLNVGNANARDLAALAASLEVLPGIKSMLGGFAMPLLEEIAGELIEQPVLVSEIRKALNDELPLVLNEGGLIRPGYNAALDELRSAATEGKTWLSDVQRREQERTGIKSLKVKYNQVFGYYIEVSKANLSLVPADYVRKQTLVNAERFITPELKELESKILGAEEKSKALEYELFQNLRQLALDRTPAIQRAAGAIAHLDVIAAFAECARTRRYVRPAVTTGRELVIRGGRHPVLECNMPSGSFVPNNVQLDGADHRMMLITGPNMAGKSTYIRQTALLVLMAQTGSFIPAEEATIGLVDRIFTRVGAADDLARGQSTFMVEMVETANILNYATPNSLVILDEIGRGTSTFDGLSIAWAVAEYLHDAPHCGCRTQFATHYHELTELAETKRGINNYNVAVREYGEKIIFLRQIVPGAADRSYGIHVAQLAGLPKAVVGRARAILDQLENCEHRDDAMPSSARSGVQSELSGEIDLGNLRTKPGVKRNGSKKTEEEPRQMRLF